MFSYMRRGPGFYRQVLVLAAPIVLQNLITSTLAMADTFMVGMLGELPMAAVTLANIPLFVVQLFIFGVQSGSTVLASQYWGKQDLDAINRVMGVAMWLVFLVSAAFAAVLLVRPVEFLSLFGNQREVIELAARYGRIAGLSYVFDALVMMYVAAYRSMERPQLGMYILVASMVVNTFLNWVLIFGKLGAPALGVEGAALATLTARVLELVIMVVHMACSRFFRVRLGLLLRPGADMVRRFLRYGGMVVCNETMWGLGTSMFPTIMGHMAGSTEILAAYTIAGNVEKICMVVAFGIGATASIIIGREIGAGRQDQLYGTGLALDTLAVLGGTVLGVLLLLFVTFVAPEWVFPLFKLSPGAESVATMMITTMALYMPLKDFNSVNIVGVLRGGGDVKASTMIDIGPLWLCAIPYAAFCGLVLRTPVFWVYMAFPLEQVVKCFIGVWRLRSGRWVRDLTRPVGE
ncbi:MATE family efflux transporter [Pseudoflavonifractor phocaeensis]|uniref:MATE family efflux transporter n=1 Tax=Pseudoflavonifractor phocaeensis TaxID=1870988 RepID=UPI001F2F0026|nr:MATE family efflux transporter [Pseudoflavonifractor phocaeensis]MCF2662389.1 MATE family efflux transporter [Pseudoflavonifractor phocaeensis]